VALGCIWVALTATALARRLSAPLPGGIWEVVVGWHLVVICLHVEVPGSILGGIGSHSVVGGGNMPADPRGAHDVGAPAGFDLL
jgi:hypothetical protein